MSEPTAEPERAAEDGPDRPEDPAVAELRDRWQRALAEADNVRKRCERLVAERVAAERQRTAAAFLPVLDHLDLALQHADADPHSIVEGVTQVRQQALDVLATLGFEPIDADGEPFDPARHEAAEAVMVSDAPPGTVVRVLRPGYRRGDLLLRPAVVAVSAPGSGDPGKEPALDG